MGITEKESCPGWCEHPGQQLETGGSAKTTVSGYYDTTEDSQDAMTLLPMQKKIPSWKSAVMDALDCCMVNLMIQQERLASIPVVADKRCGYISPTALAEQVWCVRSMLYLSEEIRKVAETIDNVEIWRHE